MKAKEKKERKPKPPFDGGYKTYNPDETGYGSKRKWQRIFNERLGFDEAKEIIKEDSPWQVLGISEGASLEEIKLAFRKLIQEWHPDRNPHRIEEATERSKQIIAAYTILTKY